MLRWGCRRGGRRLRRGRLLLRRSRRRRRRRLRLGHGALLLQRTLVLGVELLHLLVLLVLLVARVVLTMQHEQGVERLLPVRAGLDQEADQPLVGELGPERAEVAKDIGVNLCEAHRLARKLVELGLHWVRRGQLPVGGEPRMRADLGHRGAAVRVHLEHAADQVACARLEVRRHLEAAGAHLAEQHLDVRVVERQAAAEQGKQDDAAAPDVARGAVVALATHDLGARVVGAAAAGLEHLLRRLQGGHAKVGDLDHLARAVEQQVLGLQVAVADAEPVAIVHAKDHLAEVVACLVRTEAPPGDEVVKQLAAGDVLHHQVQLLARLVHVPEAEQVRVLDELHDHNLALDPERKLVLLGGQIAQAHPAVEQHLLRHNLHCGGHLRVRVHREAHAARGALPDQLAELPGADVSGVVEVALLLPLQPGRRAGVHGRGGARLLLHSSTRRAALRVPRAGRYAGRAVRIYHGRAGDARAALCVSGALRLRVVPAGMPHPVANGVRSHLERVRHRAERGDRPRLVRGVRGGALGRHGALSGHGGPRSTAVSARTGAAAEPCECCQPATRCSLASVVWRWRGSKRVGRLG